MVAERGFVDGQGPLVRLAGGGQSVPFMEHYPKTHEGSSHVWVVVAFGRLLDRQRPLKVLAGGIQVS